MFRNLGSALLSLTALAIFPSSTHGQTSPELDVRGEAIYNAFSNVYFIKERNVGSGRTEVHVLDHSSGYSVPTEHYASVFDGNEWQNGDFQVVGGDLFYIKLQNTGSGKVELHRATKSSGYQTFSVQTATAFDLIDGDRGSWSVDDGNLYFIKTRDTGSGLVEVHRAGRSNYQNYDLHQATSIPDFEGDSGKWTIVGKNLYFVKYRMTRGNNVEVHQLSPRDGYQRKTVTPTWFSVYDGDNGTWDIGSNGDLYFIKTENTGSGKVEVHVATAASGYQQVFHYASWVGLGDGPNGEWSV